MKTEELLDLALKVERKAAEIYRLLYDRFKDDYEAAGLWHSMALDEDDHAYFIDMQMKMMKTVPGAFGEISTDISPLKETLVKMDEIALFLRQNQITLEKALSVAIQIEREMVEERYNDLVKIVSPSLKKIFSNLTGRTEHVAKLDSFAHKLNTNKPIKSI